MANKMLIDATHPEETRVVVTRGNRVEEFDFESASRKPLRGNIYLAKVTRVEPSLQAAFVEYGGNRHGFLAFSEIHPDYYQIPVADRQALIEDEERYEREQARRSEHRNRRRRHQQDRVAGPSVEATESGETPAEGAAMGEIVAAEIESPAVEQAAAAEGQQPFEGGAADAEGKLGSEASEGAESSVEAQPAETHAQSPESDEQRADDETEADAEASEDESEEDDEDEDDEESSEEDEEDTVEQLGGDAMEEMPERPRHARRHYKIQEVIKRRQILLVQVAKEERGTKGAALTTYLSLAGRYSVLMPNTARGGGVSRKITSAQDRKRLKELVQDLEVPEGMGIILRTAGASRTRSEIKRDFEYLLRMWESVRELTLESTAPALVYEEGSLIKRSIRDLYSRDIDEIFVAGEEGHREAKDFMRMLMPSHAKQVRTYREPTPLFARFGVEQQLDAMFSNQVTLKSGGYLVINQAEALVAIDVNSGRSTREHNIEDTALKTNLEAADEVARQLRLRDLAGLIVIDFIDMEERRNNRAVEKRVKEALKNDRARIQVGRISPFGLLEMSRQRLRTGVVESSSIICPHCGGSGHMRAPHSVALQILRILEDQLIRSNAFNLIVRAPTNVAVYLLNAKRAHLRAIEQRFGVTITIQLDDHLGAGKTHLIEKGDMIPESLRVVVKMEPAPAEPEEEEDDFVEEEDEDEAEDERAEDSEEERESEGQDAEARERDGEREGGRRRRRRRRRGRGDRGPQGDQPSLASSDEARDSDESEDDADADADAEGGEEQDGETRADDRSERSDDGRRRRRGRRGGRRDRRDRYGDQEQPAHAANNNAAESVADEGGGEPAIAWATASENDAAETTPVNVGASEAAAAPVANDIAAAPVVEAPAPVAAPTPEPEPETAKPAPRAPVTSNPDAYKVNAADPAAPKKGGWWAKAKQALGGE
ncbi:ribonuclease E/G [Terrarubrum flagellatum]|uniref:Rne/Rng family ribonuclease n=1 Tax=Terrirubrum flagellatum TaxID=2895980 RepID=UPI003145655E